MSHPPLPARRLRRSIVLLAATGALAAAAPAPAAAAELGCTLTSTGGTVTRTLGDRSYLVHVPAGLSGPEVPLLLSLHGAGSNGSQDERFTGWSGFADARGFIVAYPNARSSTGGLWDPYAAGSPDVGFLRDVVRDVSARWCIDPRRVHVDGWSNGAVMSQRAACDAADLFASVSSYAGGTPTLGGAAAPCRPSRSISVALVVGMLDPAYTGLALNTSEWRGYDACDATPARTSDTYGMTDTYSCAAGTEVISRSLFASSHEWPSGAAGEDQRNRLWTFYEANRRP